MGKFRQVKFYEGLTKETLVALWREQVAAADLEWAISGPLFHDVFEPDFDAWRFYEDGTESGSSPAAAEDTSLTARNPGTDPKVHLRARVQEIGAGSSSGATTDDYGLEYSKNSGAYTAVTAASSNVQIDTASGLTADGATTNRATNGITDGSGSFVAGEQEETNGVIEDHQLTADNFTEHVWALTLVDGDLADGDTLDFRITLNAGAPGMTNTVVPRITISKAATAAYDQAAFRFRNDDGTLITATNIAAENTDVSLASDAQIRLRLQFNETAGGATAAGVDLSGEYNHNSGGWTTINASSSVIKSIASAFVSNAAVISNDYLATAGGTFRDGHFDSDDARTLMFRNGDGVGNDHSELEFSLVLVPGDLSGGDIIDLRWVLNAGSTPLDAYTQIPRITVGTTATPKTAAVTAGATAASSLKVTFARTASVTAGAAVTALRTIGKSASAAAGAAVAQARKVSVAATVTAGASTAASLLKVVQLTAGVTAGATVASSLKVMFERAAGVTAGATVVSVRKIGKSAAVSAGAVAAQARKVSVAATVTAGATAAASLLKVVQLTAGAAAGATVAVTMKVSKSAAVTAGALAVSVRKIGKSVAISAGASVAQARKVSVAAAVGAGATAVSSLKQVVQVAANVTAGATVVAANVFIAGSGGAKRVANLVFGAARGVVRGIARGLFRRDGH